MPMEIFFYAHRNFCSSERKVFSVSISIGNSPKKDFWGLSQALSEEGKEPGKRVEERGLQLHDGDACSSSVGVFVPVRLDEM